MPTQTTTDFPHYHNQLSRLVRQHQELEDELLQLAIYYRPRRDLGDVFLFEVIDGFGSNSINTEEDFFEATFSASPELRLRKDQRLHLILTNPVELKHAYRHGWAKAEELIQAIFWDKAYDVLYMSQNGTAYLQMISLPRPGLRG